MRQGRLGNCWFLAALAALADIQDGALVRSLLPKQRHRSRAGAYVVRLCLGGRWRAALVDDRLPCRAAAVEGGGDQLTWGLAFCRTGRMQLWASLVEKGLAKLCGSYEATVGGLAGDAFPMITGWPCMVQGLDMPCQETAWALLRDLVAKRLLTVCSSQAGVERYGLQPEHVYTLLDAIEVTDPAGEGNSQLVKLRDPQKTSEWNGRWSDGSACWTPEMRVKLGCTPETGMETGVIFLALEDFLMHFRELSACEARSSEWSEQRIPLTPSNGSCQGLVLEVAKAATCVVSLCLPYEHDEARKPTTWLSLLRIERQESAAAARVRLLSRTRFALESTVSLEFSLQGSSAPCILVPFCSIPGKNGLGCTGAALEGTWACFSKERLLRCEVRRLTWDSFKELEDASADSFQWRDRGVRGLSGDGLPWREPFVQHFAEA